MNIERTNNRQIYLQSQHNVNSLTQNKTQLSHSDFTMNQHSQIYRKVLKNVPQDIQERQGKQSFQNIIEPTTKQQTMKKNKNRSLQLNDIPLDQGRPLSQGQRQIQNKNKKDKAQSQIDYNQLKKKSKKMPQSVLLLIRSIAKGQKDLQIADSQLQLCKNPQQKQDQKPNKSEISKSLFKRYKQLNKRNDEKFTCQICACQYLQVQKVNISNNKCMHFFCDSCLRHYIDYKVGKFQQIYCPAEQCKQYLDNSTKFFDSLSDIQKQKYRKIVKFYSVAKNPNIRLCPDEKCQDGVLNLFNNKNQEQQQLKCNKCNMIYCKECFLPQHSGKCDRNQVNFFQNNLHYRQCSSCKKIVEKSQGCNHMTCICGYQFCYMCGRKWTGYNHKCSMVFNTIMRSYRCFQNCSEIGGEGIIGQIIRIIIKVVLGAPFFILLLITIFLKALFITLVFLALTCILGPTYYACRFLCQYGGCCCCFFTILFPITILIGLGVAFCDLFVEVFLDAWIGFGDEVKEITEGVFRW